VEILVLGAFLCFVFFWFLNEISMSWQKIALIHLFFAAIALSFLRYSSAFGFINNGLFSELDFIDSHSLLSSFWQVSFFLSG
ncbi:Uncharacterized protein APZ42_010794, partial [Daphnia magna]